MMIVKEIIKAWSEGKEIQFLTAGNEWVDLPMGSSIKYADEEPERFRIKENYLCFAMDSFYITSKNNKYVLCKLKGNGQDVLDKIIDLTARSFYTIEELRKEIDEIYNLTEERIEDFKEEFLTALLYVSAKED